MLQKDEYAQFHARLMRLLDFDAQEGDRISIEDAQKMMEEDFIIDSGSDGLVGKEEFMHAVFQVNVRLTERASLAIG